MAQGELYEGIIQIRVDDGDAPARIQQILEQIRARFAAAVSSMPEINAGLDDTGLTKAVTSIDQVIAHMERLRAVMGEASTTLGKAGGSPVGQAYMDAQLRDMDALIAKTRELEALRQRTGASMDLGTQTQVARAQAEADRAVRERDARRARQEAEGLPATPVAGSTRNARRPTGLEIKAAQQAQTMSERLAEMAGKLRGGARSVEELAVALQQLMPAASKAQAQMAAAKAFDQPVGKGTVTDDGRFQASREDIARRAAAEQDAQALDELTRARGREAAAHENFEQVLARGAKTQEEADLRAMQAYNRAEDATANRVKVEGRAAAAAEKEARSTEELAARQEARAKILESPQLQAATEGDKDKLLGAMGVDQSLSLKRQQVQLEQSILERKAIELTAASQTAAAEGDIAKLTKLSEDQARVRLRIQAKVAEAQALSEAEIRAGKPTGGFVGGLLGNYGTGTQGGMGDLANQAGFALKYYAFYQAFALTERALTDVVDNTREYSLAVNQLSIALGTNYTEAERVAQGYANIGNSLATAPALAVNAAVQFQRAFPDADKGLTGRAGARTGSLINLLEGGEPEDQQKLREDLVAIAENYKTGAGGVEGIYDAATSIAQSYQYAKGGDLLSGFAQIADLTSESGYSKEQGLALIASVMQRTGGSSDVAAGDLKRFLGRSGQKSFEDVFSQFGISHNQTLREQLGELAEMFDKLNESQRNTIISRLGGGRAGAAVAAGILDYAKQQQASAKAVGDQGISAEQAGQRLETFAGKLQQIAADWAMLTTDIGKSGLANAFGAALDAVHPLLTALDMMVNRIATLPGPVKDLASALMVLVGSLKLLALAKGAEGISGLLGEVGGGRFAAQAAAVAGGGARFTVDSAGVAQLNTRVGALRTAALGAAGALGPLVAVLAALVAVSKVEQEHKVEGASQRADDRLLEMQGGPLPVWGVASGGWKGARAVARERERAQREAVEPEALRATAKGLRQDAEDIRKSDPGKSWKVFRNIGKVFTTPIPEMGDIQFDSLSANEERAAQIEAEADRLEKRAKARRRQIDQAARKTEAGMTPTQGFFGPDYRRVSAGLADITGRGVGAEGAGRLLSDLVSHISTNPSDQLADLLQPGTGMTGIAKVIQDLQTNIAQAGLGNTDATSQLARLRQLEQQLLEKAQAGGDTAQIAAARQIVNEGEKAYWDQLVKNVQDQAGAVDQLDPTKALGQLRKVMASGRQLLSRAREGGNEAEINQARQISQQGVRAWGDAVVRNTTDRINSIKALNGQNARTNAQVRSLAGRALSELSAQGDVQGVAQILNEVDKKFLEGFNGNLRLMADALRAQKAAIEAALAAASAMQNVVTEEVNGLPFRHGSSSAQQIELGGRRGRVESRLDRVRRQIATMSSATAIAAPTGSAFEWPKDSGGASDGPTAADVELARLESLKQPGDSVQQAAIALRQARYKLAHAKDRQEYYQALAELHNAQHDYAQAQLQRTTSSLNARQRPGDSVQRAAIALQVARRQLAGADADGRYDAMQQVNQAEYDLAQARSQRAVALTQSREVVGDPLSAARIALQVARQQLAHAGPDDYYGALRQLHQAQYDLASAEQAKATSAAQLRIDITDPVAQARDKVREARAKLTYDRRRGADTTADLASLRLAVSDAEAAHWNQRFSDMQTNYQLQRISLGAYLSYLRSQHDYLTNVKDKTRQQVDELNQVDQALKSAADSMNGQFNLGSIKLPTVYEVRRAIESRSGLRADHGAAGARSQAPGQTINFRIDGADTGYILSLFTKYIGQPTLGSVTTTTRRN